MASFYVRSGRRKNGYVDYMGRCYLLAIGAYREQDHMRVRAHWHLVGIEERKRAHWHLVSPFSPHARLLVAE